MQIYVKKGFPCNQRIRRFLYTYSFLEQSFKFIGQISSTWDEGTNVHGLISTGPTRPWTILFRQERFANWIAGFFEVESRDVICFSPVTFFLLSTRVQRKWAIRPHGFVVTRLGAGKNTVGKILFSLSSSITFISKHQLVSYLSVFSISSIFSFSISVYLNQHRDRNSR